MTKSILDKLAEKPCCICGFEPVQVHHILDGSVAEAGIVKGMGRRTDDRLGIPLCFDCHAELHRGIATWEASHGTQMMHLYLTSGITPERALAISQERQRKPYKRPSKVLAR